MQNICHSRVGIVGGMGSYATVHLFRKLVDAFPVEKEWQRPRIIIDNNCIMPSRVRAILYEEKRDQLVRMLSDSIAGLLAYKVDALVLACNTSHCFLPEIQQRIQIPPGVLIDLLDTVATWCEDSGITDVLVIATEGTIATKVYDGYCNRHGIATHYPDEQDQPVLRKFIEAVKQRKWDGLADEFADYLDGLDHRNVVMGCTELSVIADALADNAVPGKQLIDPVQIVVNTINDRIIAEQTPETV